MTDYFLKYLAIFSLLSISYFELCCFDISNSNSKGQKFITACSYIISIFTMLSNNIYVHDKQTVTTQETTIFQGQIQDFLEGDH